MGLPPLRAIAASVWTATTKRVVVGIFGCSNLWQQHYYSQHHRLHCARVPVPARPREGTDGPQPCGTEGGRPVAARAKVLVASDSALDLLALQIVFRICCRYSFDRLVPRTTDHHAKAALGAYYCLSVLEPSVVGEARDYLN